MDPVKQNNIHDDSSSFISLDEEDIKTEPPDDIVITLDLRLTPQVIERGTIQPCNDVVEDVNVQHTVFEVNPSCNSKEEQMTSPLNCGNGWHQILLDGEASNETQTEIRRDCPAMDDLFTCDICGQTYKQFICLSMHLKTHQGNGPYSCDVCSKIYKLSKTFLNHILIHNIDNQIESQICDHSKLQSKDNQERVLRNQRKRKAKETAHSNHSCEFCDCSFQDFEELKLHVATHQQKSPTSKNDQHSPSKLSTPKRRGTRSETLSSPRKKPNQTTSEQSRAEVANMTVCEAKSKGKRKLEKPVCEEKSKRKRKLEKPESLEGDRNTKVSKTFSSGCHRCVECGEMFTDESLLRKHLLEHLKCDVCKRVFGTYFRYKKHILVCKRKPKAKSQIRQVDKSYKCKECREILQGETSFKNHLLEHFKKVFVFHCDECGMKFTSESKLQHHTTEKHTEVQCTECDQLFTPEHMRHHLKVHKGNGISNNEPYQCEVCYRVFKASSSLKKHMNFHYPVETYNCEVCCRKFNNFGHLKSHMKTHPQMEFLSLNPEKHDDALCKENDKQTEQFSDDEKESHQKSIENSPSLSESSSDDEKGSQLKRMETSPHLRVSLSESLDDDEKGSQLKSVEASPELRVSAQENHIKKGRQLKSARNKLKTGKVNKVSCNTKTAKHVPREKAKSCCKNGSKIDTERTNNQVSTRKKELKRYSNRTNSSDNMDQINSDTDENETSASEEGNSIVMPESCKKTYSQKKDIKEHSEQNLTSTIRKTPVKLVNTENFSKHKSTPPSTQQRTVTISKYSCGECDESFTEKDLIDSHMIKHLSELYTFECDVCGTRMLTQIGLKKHILNNHTETPCVFCGQMFSSVKTMKEHSLSHSDESSKERQAREEKTQKTLLYSQRKAKKHEYYNRYCSGTLLQNFTCPVCEKPYDRSAALLFLSHVKYHTKWLKVEQSIERDILSNQTGDKLTNDTAHVDTIESQNMTSTFISLESNDSRCSTDNQNFVNLHDTRMEDFWNSSLLENMDTLEPVTGSNVESSFEPLNQVYASSTETEELKNSPGNLLAKINEEQTHTHHSVEIQVWTVKKLFKCERCKMKFKKEHYWKLHNNMCSDEMMCDHCGKVFNGKRKLQWHMRQDHLQKAPGTCVCHICGGICKNYYALKIHKLEKHPSLELNKKNRKNRHLCEQCGMIFNTKSLLGKHLQLVHQRKELTCEICGKSFVHEIVMKRHIKAHKIMTDRSALQAPVALTSTCDICGERMMKRSMKIHRQLVHNIKRCKICGEDVLSDTYLEHSQTHLTLWNCDICGKQFQRAKNFAKHKTVFHTKRSCGLCDFVCESNQELTHHTKMNHSARKTCNLCDKTFKTIKNLRIHRDIVHTKRLEVSCHICGQLSDKFKIKRHMKKHGDLPHCSVCFKKFLSKKLVERHIREIHSTSKCDACGVELTNGLMKYHKKKCSSTHTNKGPEEFKCQFCGIIFKNLIYLKKHLGKHLISKTHACTKCDMKFDSAVKLTHHQRVHTINECKDCGKKYESRHKYLHSPKKCKSRKTTVRSEDNDPTSAKCNICGKGFKTKSLVKRHMFSHTREIYACQLCKFNTKSESFFERHKELHKKKEKKSNPSVEKDQSKKGKIKKTYSKTCDLCNKEIKSILQFQRHMALHTGINTFECSICGRGFATKVDYRYHLGAHLVEDEKMGDANKPDDKV